MSAIHAAFGLFGSIIRVLPMPFRPVLAALHLGLHDLGEALFFAFRHLLNSIMLTVKFISLIVVTNGSTFVAFGR
jgi:hypothetical protein